MREQVTVGGVKTPDSKLILGDRCLINQSAFLNTTMSIIIGNDTAIGGRSLLFTHSSWLSQMDGFPVKFGPIIIGNKVWISWQSFITANIKIGDNCIVQPNTVLTKNLPPNSTFTNFQNRIIPNFLYEPLSLQKKIHLVKQIMLDFIKYLEYQGIQVESKDAKCLCMIDDINYRIIVQEDSEVEILKNYSNIIVLFKGLNSIKGKKRNVDMILSLEGNERIGSNLLGEELVKFLSRYGIRFNRLD